MMFLTAKLYPTIMSGLVLRIYKDGEEIASASRDGVTVRSISTAQTGWLQVLIERLESASRALASDTTTVSQFESLVVSVPAFEHVQRARFGDFGTPGTPITVRFFTPADGEIEINKTTAPG